MFKAVFGTRQPGGPFIRAGLLMALINVSSWELQGQGVVFIEFQYFHLFNVAETTGVSEHWILLGTPTLILVGMSLNLCVVLAGNVPVAVVSVSLLRDICGG